MLRLNKIARSMSGRLLMRLARSEAGGQLAGWMFANLPSALPIRRIYETDAVVAFYHPLPSYPLHILIVPKQRVPSLLDVSPDDGALLSDVIDVAQRIVRELKLVQQGYRLEINGGLYQDVQQLHVHLISHTPVAQ